MSELAVKSSSWIRADPWECSEKQWSRTLVVLKHFKQILDGKYNDKQLRLMLLCGGDVVDSFQRITPSGAPLWEPADVAAIMRDFGQSPFFHFNITEVFIHQDRAVVLYIDSLTCRVHSPVPFPCPLSCPLFF